MKGTKPQLVVDNGTVSHMPAPPDWLSDEAKKEWRRAMPGLVERGILTEGDIASFENYCLAQGHVRELESDIRAVNDLKVKTSLLRSQDKAMASARQMAAELGLTPISRSRPAMRDLFEGDDDDPLAF